jgi:hypothetical protein
MGFKADKKFVAILMSGLLLVIVGQVIPMLGTVMEDATPDAGPTSEWNNTYRADVNGTYAGELLPETSDVWGNLVTILGAALSLLAIFYAISPIIGKDLFGGK